MYLILIPDIPAQSSIIVFSIKSHSISVYSLLTIADVIARNLVVNVGLGCSSWI